LDFSSAPFGFFERSKKFFAALKIIFRTQRLDVSTASFEIFKAGTGAFGRGKKREPLPLVGAAPLIESLGSGLLI